MAKKAANKKTVETITHAADKRKNIPTAEYQSVVKQEQQRPIPVKYPRNTDLDPQLVWRGKDEQDWSDLVVHAPPLYIQEKVHPKVLIDALLRQSREAKDAADRDAGKKKQLDLFADFNGVPEGNAKTEFYQHDQNWSNRMILGDSLQVMASLAEREGLRGKVQCIYFDPPYGIRFNSNFQWSTTSRDVKDGNSSHITREPEQVKAFRDTWRDGIHSYLTYLRDRLTVARDLLTNSGSLFVQIGDENVHRIRAAMEEVFGESNFVSQVTLKKSSGLGGNRLPCVCDYILWFAKDIDSLKYRQIYDHKGIGSDSVGRYQMLLLADGSIRRITSDEENGNVPLPKDSEPFSVSDPTAQGFRPNTTVPYQFRGQTFHPGANRCWRSTVTCLDRVAKASRFVPAGKGIAFLRKLSDYPVFPMNNIWTDVGGIMSRDDPKIYVVQTSTTIVQRCLLMATDPGDLVLDPTCGSGTTATVAEQWGRRWITVDTSRVALALARARIMGARYSYYLLSDSKDGQAKEAEVTCTAPSTQPTHGNIRHGFVYERVPHITLKSIANNAEIDVIWEKWQQTLEPLRNALNKAIGKDWEEWEIPRHAVDPWCTTDQKLYFAIRSEQEKGEESDVAKIRRSLNVLNGNLKRFYTLDSLPAQPADPWPQKPTQLHAQWWEARIARQKEIDGSIRAKAEFEYLYDRPYDDKRKVRVAGPFTVESLSPHRILNVDENDDVIDPLKQDATGDRQTFAQMILDNLKIAGVQQAHKEGRITFTALVAWPGNMVCAEGRYFEGDAERRAAIVIGQEFGTLQRQDLVLAAREAGDAGFDVVIACAFNFDAHSTEFNKLGRISRQARRAVGHHGNQRRARLAEKVHGCCGPGGRVTDPRQSVGNLLHLLFRRQTHQVRGGESQRGECLGSGLGTARRVHDGLLHLADALLNVLHTGSGHACRVPQRRESLGAHTRSSAHVGHRAADRRKLRYGGSQRTEDRAAGGRQARADGTRHRGESAQLRRGAVQAGR